MAAQEYYPQHFRNTRPYARALIEQMQALERRGELNPETSFDCAAKLIVQTYSKGGMKPQEMDRQAYTIEIQSSLMYSEWVLNGSAVYALEPSLVEALSGTSMDDVTMSDLRFPYPCIYFHFGPQPGLTLSTGVPITGAYVLFGGSVRISLAAPAPQGKKGWYDRPLEIYDLRIDERHFGAGLEKAIEMALRDDLESIHDARAQILLQSKPWPSMLRAADAMVDMQIKNLDVYRRCVQLVANALCYITAYPEDVRDQWQAGTPENMRVRAESGTPKERERARSKLSAMGYRRVHRVGGDFTAASAAATISPHWRRGHWRRQRHGPGNTLTKLIWMNRTRILGGSVSDEPRVYSAGQPGESSSR